MDGSLEKRICAIYTRVSTEDQAREGFSLGEQRQRLADYCQALGYEIAGYYEDAGISAKTGNYRPEFERMLEDGKTGLFNTVLALKLDRISRSVFDMEKINKYFEENNLSLVCLYDQYDTSTANGRMIQRIMTSVAQNEIDRTSERTKIGLDGAIKNGHIPARTPVGYRRVDKKLEIDSVASLVVEKIFKLYARGKSHYKIAEQLNEENALHRSWSDSSIRRILENPVYKGDYVTHKGKKDEKYYENVCPAIIDDELWDYCQAQAPKNQKHYQRNKVYLFLHKLCCPTCGRPMGGKGTKKDNGKIYYYYHCLICNNNIGERGIEKQLLRDLNDIFEYDAIVHQYYFPLIKSKLGMKPRNYEREIKLLESKKDKIADAFVDGTFDKETYKRKEEEILDSINQLKRMMLESKQISKMTFSREDLLVTRDIQFLNKIMLPVLYDKFVDSWHKASREVRSDLVLDYVDNIELDICDSDVIVKKINFRDSFYKNFQELYWDGFLDYDITKRLNKKSKTIRYSEYIPPEKIGEHIYKLRCFYSVDNYPGLFNYETGELFYFMSKDTELVRISPIEKPNYHKDGYHGSVGVNIVGADKTEENFPDLDVDLFDVLMKKMDEIKEDWQDIKVIE